MNELTAIILAAGTGERLKPLTSERPKALVEVAGVSLIERTIDGLRQAGVSEMAAVVGHCAEKLDGLGLELIFNRRYADANNIYSLWVARDLVRRGCYIVNSDVIFDPAIAAQLVDASGSVILTDDSIGLDDEAMKAVTEAGRLTKLSKEARFDENRGEYIGLARIDPADGESLAAILDDFVNRDDVQVYYEDAIEQLAGSAKVCVESVAGYAWAEIDDLKDLEYAELKVATRIDSKEYRS